MLEKLQIENFNGTLISELGLSKVFIQFGNGMISKGKISKEDLLKRFSEISDNPSSFENDSKFRWLANRIMVALNPDPGPKMIEIPDQPKNTYPIWGKENIEDGAFSQMRNAMRLPITVAGALMSDSHQGYGVPIGGVIATHKDFVIPFAVGVDISCMMNLTIYDVSPGELDKYGGDLKKCLLKNSHFGIGSESDKILDESVLEKEEWKSTQLLRSLKDMARRQLGSSGSGNHFVEFGTVEVEEFDDVLNVNPGRYLAVLSHSGSRGVGARIADHYSRIAEQKVNLPKDLMNLAWLDLNTEEGQEYWLSMNLAGEFASACHHEIHNKITKDLKYPVLKTVENYHNFCWREKLEDGTEVNVHRKGATPAGKDVLGIIPGTMAHPGYIVKGLGNPSSINSASHGAGRAMSRRKARENLSKESMKIMLKKLKIELIGADLDEAPAAYKNIDSVMSSQSDLVKSIGKFIPRIVRMADSGEPSED